MKWRVYQDPGVIREVGTRPPLPPLSEMKSPDAVMGLVYKHHRSGDLYTVQDIALREHDLAKLVVYRSMNTGHVFARPLAEWAERFKLVNAVA